MSSLGLTVAWLLFRAGHCATSDQMAISGTRLGQAYFVGSVMIGCRSSIVEMPIMYESEDAG
jgi:hypothetical protein